MATSFQSYLPRPRPRDTSLQLRTGEVVDLHINQDIFHNNGQLKGTARFSVGQDIQLFSLAWPSYLMTTPRVESRWRLIITQATTDRIASFSSDTAENLGSSGWEVVKEASSKCREHFKACLMSMSCQEIVFTHADQQSAEKMKESNEMVDIMNKLLADTEYNFCDIMIDWEVKITQDPETEPIVGDWNSFVCDAGNSNHSGISESGEELLPQGLQAVLDIVRSEQQKSQEAMAKMAEENANRHRILCQKLEEIKSTLSNFHHRLCELEAGGKAGESGISSGSRSGSDTPQNHENEHFHGRQSQGDSIPAEDLFRSSEDIPASSYSQRVPSSSGRNRPPKNDERAPKQASHKSHTRSSSQTHHRQRDDESAYSGFFDDDTDLYQRDHTKPSETFTEYGEKTKLSGSDLENQNLDEAVERAYLHDVEPPPKAKSYYTVLCLDTSESMHEHGAYEEMINFVNEFIDGVEDIVDDTGVEENIGVVTFGGTSTVVQNLTNDFTRVRDAVDAIQLGGRSPFVQALLVSMAAFVEKAGIISVSGVYDVRPRVIFVSDGYPTENIEEGADFPHNKMHVRTSLMRLMVSFATKDKYDKVRPVVYVPVGQKADKELMKSMATLGKGVYAETKDVKKLCGYYMMQETIGKTMACLKERDLGDENIDQRILALATSLMPNMDKEQKQEVVDAVKRELKNPTKKYRSHASNFEDVYEDTDKVNAGERLPLGTRVVRGIDWRWDNQDGGGPGTVVSHSDKRGWTWVVWDHGGNNRYPFGPEQGYHIWKTDDHPRLMEDDGELKIGMTVEKGPDWSSAEERLQNVRTGVVIRKSKREKKLMVRWDNGEMQVVRWGAENKYDVIYCNPQDIPTQPPFEFSSFSSAAPGHHEASPSKQTSQKPQAAPAEILGEGMWQWQDNKDWRDYPEETSSLIERAYKKKPGGSCIIVRNGKNCRVMFRRMVEKVVDEGVECPVQRVQLCD